MLHKLAWHEHEWVSALSELYGASASQVGDVLSDMFLGALPKDDLPILRKLAAEIQVAAMNI